MGDRLTWLVRAENAALGLAAATVYGLLDYSLWWFLGLLLALDISLLGYAFGPRIGAWAYNTAHSWLLPVALLSAWGVGVDWGLPGALIAAAHIGGDRALGFGLKRETGFRDTHLGRMAQGRFT